MKTLTVPWPIIVLFLLLLPFQVLAQGLTGAHAHNDYYHPRPLLDALSHGFCSVEADIFLVDGQLLVGHDEEELIRGRTLEALYLEPLRQRVGQRGSVQGQGCDFSLLIDVKSDGNQTWEQLETLLGEYRSILTQFSDDEVQKGAVTVLISGNRSASRMLR
ncbi:MAG: hypothetical protein JSU96_01055 [Acidobacteriota bacterium]|nr:MAG: hypothetical protein JSU96_01055 [Acidobacteriota bacterium]